MSALMEQDATWKVARTRLGIAPSKPRMRLRRPASHPLWVPTLLMLPPPRPDWAGTPTAPYDVYVAPPPSRPGPYRWRDIVEEVAAKHGVFMSDMRSVRRGRAQVAARHEAMWRLRNETTMSLPEIGRRLGGRDHTTVLHGVKRHQERLDKGIAK